MSAPTRTPRSSWIEEGLRALAAGGPDAVRIELLARALGVTRGSFYCHFDDRRALLEEILDTWERVSVDEVIERVESEGGDARAKLRRLSALAASSDEPLRIDLAVRDWARREQTVAERLRRVDNRRMDYLRSLFGAFCPDEDDVEARYMVFYSLWIGSHFIAADHGARSRADVLKLALRRLKAQRASEKAVGCGASPSPSPRGPCLDAAPPPLPHRPDRRSMASPRPAHPPAQSPAAGQLSTSATSCSTRCCTGCERAAPGGCSRTTCRPGRRSTTTFAAGDWTGVGSRSCACCGLASGCGRAGGPPPAPRSWTAKA